MIPILLRQTSSSKATAMLTICFIFLFLVLGAHAAQDFCSNSNTAETGSYFSTYMSNGWCENKCRNANYAVAIVQNHDCWCSNTVPNDTDGDCNTDCPGYPYEKCGGDSSYGYIKIGNPSSTSEQASSTTSNESSSSSSSSSSSDSESSASTSTSTTSSETSNSTSTSSTSSSSTAPSTSVKASTSIAYSTQVVTTQATVSSSTVGTSIVMVTSTHVASQTPKVKTITSIASLQDIKTSIITSIYYSTVNNDSNNVTAVSTGKSSSVVSSQKVVTSASTLTTATTAMPSSSSSFVASSSSSSALASSSLVAGASLGDTGVQKKDSFFDHRGKVAGLFTGVGIAIVLLIALLVFFCLRCQAPPGATAAGAGAGGLAGFSRTSKHPRPMNYYNYAYPATATAKGMPTKTTSKSSAVMHKFLINPVLGFFAGLGVGKAISKVHLPYHHRRYDSGMYGYNNETIVGTPRKSRFSTPSFDGGNYPTPVMFYPAIGEEDYDGKHSSENNSNILDTRQEFIREKAAAVQAAIGSDSNATGIAPPPGAVITNTTTAGATTTVDGADFNFLDDRLQPPMGFIDPNESNPSLQDNKDYTRRLKIINP